MGILYAQYSVIIIKKKFWPLFFTPNPSWNFYPPPPKKICDYLLSTCLIPLFLHFPSFCVNRQYFSCSANPYNFPLHKITICLQHIPSRFLNKLSKEGTHYDSRENTEAEVESIAWPNSFVVKLKLMIDIVEEWNVEEICRHGDSSCD